MRIHTCEKQKLGSNFRLSLSRLKTLLFCWAKRQIQRCLLQRWCNHFKWVKKALRWTYMYVSFIEVIIQFKPADYNAAICTKIIHFVFSCRGKNMFPKAIELSRWMGTFQYYTIKTRVTSQNPHTLLFNADTDINYRFLSWRLPSVAEQEWMQIGYLYIQLVLCDCEISVTYIPEDLPSFFGMTMVQA